MGRVGSRRNHEKRQANLSADLATTQAHASDPLTITGRSGDTLAALGNRLDALPDLVRETRRIAVGQYRGLGFGLVLHPGGAAEVSLEGAATRHGPLSRDHRGPRAVLNALDRLCDSYQGQDQAIGQELAIAHGQLRDYQARIGREFAHDADRVELAGLRDQLKAGLSLATPEPCREAVPVAELAERIKALKAAQTIEAAAERTAGRRIAAEEPVTAWSRRRIEPALAALPPHGAARSPADPATIDMALTAIEPQQAAIHPFPKPPGQAAALEPPGYRQLVASDRRQRTPEKGSGADLNAVGNRLLTPFQGSILTQWVIGS